METMEIFILSTMLAMSIGFLIFVIIKVYKSEQIKKKWITNIKKGDRCKISAIDKDKLLNDVEIIKLDDDKVTVEITVDKKWVYPPKIK